MKYNIQRNTKEIQRNSLIGTLYKTIIRARLKAKEERLNPLERSQMIVNMSESSAV